MKRILVVDDDAQMTMALKEAITRANYEVEVFQRPKEALRRLKEGGFCLVVTDMKMPEMDGLEFIKAMRTKGITLPVLVITGFATVENAVECMKLGAADYLMKPFSFKTLKDTIDKLTGSLPEDRDFVTENPRMKEILQIALSISDTDATVLITGESGTGKEMLARFIHRHSPRASKPFVAVNCAAIPENLLESELFGYEKGAFTGALTRRLGKFEQAQGGTLVLDEIGDMPLQLQVKLLRVLQEKEIEPLGGNGAVKLDVRIIATTNRTLEEEVKEGRFREDLYWRLNVIVLEIPPLRERPEDIEPLSRYFLSKYATQYRKPLSDISPEAVQKLKAFHWPGNVRQLENTIQRAVLLSRSEVLKAEDIVINLTDFSGPNSSSTEIKSLREMEKEMIVRALKVTSGNRTKAAEFLGISVRTLRNKLHEYGLQGVSNF
ncbi:MAG: sigma-54-dependent Fis family transcriptional regulator [Nitrospirae bacterium]|nr:MAG: sigma-54-dependent Fis family transcriptional regulator [Nitrospirota bacterium]